MAPRLTSWRPDYDAINRRLAENERRFALYGRVRAETKSIRPNPETGESMPSIEQLDRQIEHLWEQRERLAAFPENADYPVGTVLVFNAKFRSSSNRDYNYAFIKTEENAWYSSGPNSAGRWSWDRVVQFMVDHAVEEVWRVTEYERDV